MYQLSLFDFIAAEKTPAIVHGGGTYFVSGTDAYKRTEGGWLRLNAILGVPKFGYRNLRKGYHLLQPDYVGASWVVMTPKEETAFVAAHTAGETLMVDSHIAADLGSHKWEWRRVRKQSDGTVSTVVTPDGGSLHLLKIPGRKVKFIYALDFYSPSGTHLMRKELGLWFGMMFFGNVDIAQQHVMWTYNDNVAELQQMIHDADSGKDFGPDRSWETTSPAMLAQKIVYATKHMTPRPLSPEEMIRLLDLNGRRNRTGRFSEDQAENLSLDHLYAELVTRYIAFKVEPEDVWGNGPNEWEKSTSLHGDIFRRGNYYVRKAASASSLNKGFWKIERVYGTNGPHLAGNYKDPQAAMDAADRKVLNRTFEERYFDGVKEDFRPVKAEIMAAGMRLMVDSPPEK